MKAKDIFSKAFTPKKILFTGIFPHVPEWHEKYIYLGVSEYDHLDDSDPHFLVKPNVTPEARLLRKELDLLAEQIAQSVYRIPKEKKIFRPYLPRDLDLNLNHT